MAILKSVLLIFGFVMLLSLWIFYLTIRPFRMTTSLTPADFGLTFEPVSFKTEDNVLIRGWFIPAAVVGAKTIILLHGYPADKGDILPSRLFLHKHYHLLFIDFRYLGESGGHYSTVGKKEILDLRAALDFLAGRGIHEVGVWGFSMGGAVALLTAPDAPGIRALIAESAYARLDWMAGDYYPIPLFNQVIGRLLQLWGRLFLRINIYAVQPAASLPLLKIPVLLIYSKKDQVVPWKHARWMQKMAGQSPNIDFIVSEDGLHGQPVDDYRERVLGFFDAAFATNRPSPLPLSQGWERGVE